MRMGGAFPRDLALATSSNLHSGRTCALIHGCDDNDLKSIETFLNFSKASIGHPMLLHLLFADLQLKRHKARHSSGWDGLLVGLHRIGLQRTNAPEVLVWGDNVRDEDLNHNEMTKEMLDVFQKSGFLEQSLAKFRTLLTRMASHVRVDDATLSQAQIDYMNLHNPRIEQAITTLIDKYDDLVKNCNLTTNGASLLISAVSVHVSLTQVQTT
jgi:hypothetical protein